MRRLPPPRSNPPVPILTGLAPDPRQSGYRLVVVDRARFASLPGDALASLRLDLGREIQARAVAARRARQLGDLPPVVRKRRLLAFLARRGYSGAAALKVVQELLEQ